MERLSELTIIVGKKGSGKTTFTKENIVNRVRKKVLIVDTFADHPAYKEYPLIPTDKADMFLKNWKSGKMLIAHPNPLELFPIFELRIRNTMLILEDAKKYLTDSTPEEIRRLIIDHKNKGIDIVLMFHTLSQVPKFIRQMYENIIIFHTKDTVQDVKKLYVGDVALSLERVNKHPDKYYCEWISE
jgi:hypothetical protein